MGLIELCLLSAMTPQGPAAGAAAAPTEAPAAARAEQDPRALLAKLESAGQYADAAALTHVATGRDRATAERAAWLLATSTNDAHLAALPQVVATANTAAARLQALHGILLRGDISSTATAIAALEDDDRRVRAMAAQVLGKLRRPAAVEPLLRLLHAAECSPDAEPTDAQAALLTLADLGASQHLLRMATDLADRELPRCGEALAYTFQELSPRLTPSEEATVLVAVLGHREPLLRRYAITRLTELDDPKSLAALDARLDVEGRELRPLLEVAVAQLMGSKDGAGAQLSPLADRAASLGARAWSWWSSKRATDQAILCAIPTALLFGLWLIQRSLRIRARDAQAHAAAALAAPSDGFEADEYEEHYGDHEEWDSADEGYEEGLDAPGWPDPCGVDEEQQVGHAEPLA